MVLDVGVNAPELTLVAHQAVVALVLPEGFARPPQRLIGPLGRDALQRSQEIRYRHVRRNEQMNMVRHDHEGVQHVVVKFGFTILDRIDHKLRDFRAVQVARARSRLIQESIHRRESLTGGQAVRREPPM